MMKKAVDKKPKTIALSLAMQRWDKAAVVMRVLKVGQEGLRESCLVMKE